MDAESSDEDVNDVTNAGYGTDDEETPPGEVARPKVDVDKALETALKENQAAKHDFAGASRPPQLQVAAGPVAQGSQGPGQTQASGGERGVGLNPAMPASGFKIPKHPKIPKLAHPPPPGPAGKKAQGPSEPRRGSGDGLLAVGPEVLAHLRKTPGAKVKPNPAVDFQEQLDNFFADDAQRATNGTASGPSPEELFVMKKYGFQPGGTPFSKQTVCLIGNQCFSLTASSQVEYEDNEQKLAQHYRLKHSNMDFELGTESSMLKRKVEEQWDDNETQLCPARFWAWPGNSTAIASQMPRKAEGVSKMNLLRDAGILIANDHVWQKLGDRENTSLKLKSLTDKSLRSEKRARLMTIHDEEGTAGVMSEDATEREPSSEREALEAVFTFVAARRLAHPLDIGPLAFQKAIVDAFFAGGLEAPGFSQAFEEYLMDSAVRARQKMPPPTYHDCRNIVERSTNKMLSMIPRSPRKQPGYPGGLLAMKHEPSGSGFVKPRSKDFKQHKPQGQGQKLTRKDFCRGYNDGICDQAQPGESCTVDGITRRHTCSLFVNQGFCNQPHTRRSHDKRL